MNDPRRHHTLPESYQERWRLGSVFYLWDVERRALRPQTPRNTAVQRDFYKAVFGSGATDFSVETLLSDTETLGKEVTALLLKGRQITMEQKADLSVFVAFLFARVERFAEAFNEGAAATLKGKIKRRIPDSAAAQAWFEGQPDLRAKFPTITPSQIVDYLHGNRYRIQIPTVHRLLASVGLAMTIAPLIGESVWELARPPESTPLITSDSPVQLAVSDPSDPARVIAAITRPDADLHVPLAPGLLLRLRGRGREIADGPLADAEAVSINRGIARNAKHFVIGAKGQLEKLFAEVNEPDAFL